MLNGLRNWLGNRIMNAERQTYDYGVAGYAPQTGTWFLDTDDESPERFFKRLTEDDLFKQSIQDLDNNLAKSDPTISRIYNDFVMFSTLESQLTCENPRGQAILDDIVVTLANKRNTINTVLARLFGSILLRGNYCFEITFADDRTFSNLFVVDPQTLYFRSDGDDWVIGQYSKESKFQPLSPDRVFFDAINPLVNDYKGHSMIAPAYPSAIGSSLMLQQLRDIVENQAWVRRLIRINDIAMKQAGYTNQEIKTRVDQAKANLKQSENLKDPDKLWAFTGEVEVTQSDGASRSGGLSFVDTIDRTLERKQVQGGGTYPFNLGSN